MADIAKGLALGYSIGERAYNAYQQADEQRRIKAIQDAQTEQSYSPDDLARLQGLYNQLLLLLIWQHPLHLVCR